ncbi:MAG: hypothetical protein DWC01_03980 [Candidatus Poseidoniales archaeon]|nr:MAG: hypothetical protein DWC01_03980 [Candidatus Poseidoniales archaeon]
MQDKSLLEVSPHDLLAIILAKRKKDASHLPKEEKKRDEELTRAYGLYNESKDALTELLTSMPESEIDSLKRTQAENVVEENETHRKRVMSRLWRVRSHLKETLAAIEYWSAMDDETLTSLLSDANRVNKGGLSTFAMNKSAPSEHGGDGHD